MAFACAQSPAPTAPYCQSIPTGCICAVQETPPSSAEAKTCKGDMLPDMACCADPSWPTSGTCQCLTSSIFCGVVPGYEPAANGQPAMDACVCSNDPVPQQTIGPSCYANGTTSSGPGLGGCCSFSADAPGAAGIPACICAPGIHTCGTGGTPIDSCTPATFPAPPATCTQGTKQVTACL